MCKETVNSWILPTGAGIAAAHGCGGGTGRSPRPEVAPLIAQPSQHPGSCAGSCKEDPVADERTDRSA